MRPPATCLFLLAAAALLAACSASSGEDEARGPSRGGSSKDGGTQGTGGDGGAGGSGTGGSGGGSFDDAGGGETCDGLDDDGDGQIDEGCTCTPGDAQKCYPGKPGEAGKGACTWGTQTCVATGSGEVKTAAWGPCTGAGAPAPEACNGKDDDCDGAVDDGCPCEGGKEQPCGSACGAGSQKCENGAWGPCTAKQPQPETCNGVDDDCDGQIDEGLVQSCSTACGAGQQQCVKGAWGPCSAKQPQAETCNNLDDDCDGQIDEGLTQPCTSPCGPGTRKCTKGTWGTCEGPTPQPEICWNFKDDDCDGLVDGFDPDCKPDGGTGEVCDGKDNNGNGKIDEGDVCRDVGEPCPPGAFKACDCYCGVHQKCQPNGTWGPCKVDGSCVNAQVTSQAACGSGYCDFGKCVNSYIPGAQCKAHKDCPMGQICDLGWCMVDPYTPCP